MVSLFLGETKLHARFVAIDALAVEKFTDKRPFIEPIDTLALVARHIERVLISVAAVCLCVCVKCTFLQRMLKQIINSQHYSLAGW